MNPCPVVIGRDRATDEPHICAENARDWSVCPVHANQLRQDLAELPALASNLHRVLTRYRSDFVSGSTAAGNPLPYSLPASETLGQIRAVLVGWIRDLDENPEHHPADNLAAMANWLHRRHHRLCTHPAAQEIVREFDQVAAAARRITEGPADRVFAGTCDIDGCSEHLMAVVKRDRVTCRACGSVHQVTERREAMESDLADKLVTAAEFATLTTWLAWPVDRHRIRTLLNVWAHRGIITAVSHSQDGPRYRFESLRIRVEERFDLDRTDLSRPA